MGDQGRTDPGPPPDEGGAGERRCPPWCVVAHDPARGEDDWLHQSEPLTLADDVKARLVMSIDPTTGEEDGPYVLVGDEQLTPAEAEQLGIELSALAALARRPQDPREEL